MSRTKRQLHFNAFLMGSGHHEAAWRLPASDPFANTDLGHWRGLAQIAERAAFDSVFLAARVPARAGLARRTSTPPPASPGRSLMHGPTKLLQ